MTKFADLFTIYEILVYFLIEIFIKTINMMLGFTVSARNPGNPFRLNASQKAFIWLPDMDLEEKLKKVY